MTCSNCQEYYEGVAHLDITVVEGDSFFWEVTWKDQDGNPIDITGYAVKMQIKDKVGGSLLIELTEIAGITVEGPEGRMTIEMTPAETASLSQLAGSPGVYDLELTAPDLTVTTIIGGSVIVQLTVTQ